MQILISDANVIIDMEDSGLTELMFRLPYQFAVPNILYYDELEEEHPNLLELGLVELELAPETVEKSIELAQCYRKPSRYDCLALAAAMQEECPLVTCDKALRKAAQQENVEIRGTIWLVDELVKHELINKDQATKAFKDMKEAGSRLPWNEVEKFLNRI